MAINIKNETTVAAVKRLAEHYGITYTAAIETAVEYMLNLPSTSDKERALAQVTRIVSEYQAHLPTTHTLNTDDLYDNQGLFR
jgi:hypothetical protein